MKLYQLQYEIEQLYAHRQKRPLTNAELKRSAKKAKRLCHKLYTKQKALGLV